MVGYLHKDRLLTHWSFLGKGISDEEIAQGIQLWTAAGSQVHAPC